MAIPLAIPIALALGGALLGGKAERDADKRRRQIADTLEAYTMGRARESRLASEGLVNTMTPELRQQDVAAKEEANRASMQSTVDAARSAYVPQPLAGKVSDEYRGAGERAAASTAERTRRAIEQLSQAGAPGDTGHDFGIRFGRAAGDVDAARDASQYVGGAYARDVASVMPSWKQKLASQLLFGLGGGLLGRVGDASGGGGAAV
jgi:hypothetical protein